MVRVTIAANSDAASRGDQLGGRRLAEQDEAEFAGLAEQQAEPDRPPLRHSEHVGEPGDQDAP